MAQPLRRAERPAEECFRERFIAAWTRTDEMFSIVPAEEILAKPIVWRHSFIFYVGHLPAFAWNQLGCRTRKGKSFNPYFDNQFCRGIDPDIDTGECHWYPRVPDAWPALSKVLEYRDQVREAILESLDGLPKPGSKSVTARNGLAINVVLEHEYMHQETLLYMLQELPLDKKIRPPFAARYSFEPASPSRGIEIPAGPAHMGARFGDLAFGWDNEFPQLAVDVPRFTIDSLPVMNGEFCQFLESGGYENERFWRPEDWKWKRLTNISHPRAWIMDNGSWFYRTLFDLIPLAQVAAWPAYVSLAEARAYASWRGKRLPTEAEFHRAAYYGPDGREADYPWGNADPGARHGNFDFVCWSPLPVGSRPAGASGWGVLELVGNGWELTDTPFKPFPGFTAYIESYADYSRDFFDGKHFVLKGASWATDANLLRASFRNWYQAHYSYVFAKFRCVS